MRYLPALIRGAISLFLYAMSLFFSFVMLLLTFLIDKILPFKRIKKFTAVLYHHLPLLWIQMNRFIFSCTSLATLEIDLPEGLNTQTFYAVTANHQAWADILVLYEVFSPHIPMLKFFMKKQLKWVPLVGQVTQIYGFPFLYRHTHAELKKHPEWKKRDYEATRKACERFAEQPGSIMIFAEGTRFTEKKHAVQDSPYRHLLKPKAGGLALALQCMQDKIHTLIDVTIVYPQGRHRFWDYCCGRAGKIFVKAELIPLSKDLKGDYENDYEFRRFFQRFLNQRWHEKDQLIGNIYENPENVKK